MNKERFHNTLALSLGYERIVNGKVVSITVDDSVNSDDPMITIKIEGKQKAWTFNASQASNIEIIRNIYDLPEEVEYIKHAVNQAYIKATTNQF